jgi:iron complex outermembrane receptor protein
VSVEGGVRGRFGADWSFEATAYRTALDRELVAFEVPSQPGRTFYRNAGESRHTGVEIAVDGRLLPDVRLRAAYTRVDGRFQRYQVDGEDFGGNRIPGISPNRLDGRLSWEAPVGFLQLRGLWRDDMPVDDADTAVSPGYVLWDLRGGLDGVDAGTVRVEPWAAVANLLDRRYDAAVTVNAFGGRYFEPGPGRTLRLGLRLTWSTR